MKSRDTLRLVFNSMKYKRLRTVLTIIGIMVGPAAIVALLSITSGFTGSITSQLTKMGATTMVVTPSGSLALTRSTVASIEKLPNVTAAIPYYSFSGNVHGNSSESITVYAVDLAELQQAIPSLSLLGGTSSSSTGAVLGYSVAYPNVTGESNKTVGKVVSLDLSKTSTSSISIGLGGGGFFSQSAGGNRGGTSRTTYSFVVQGVYSKFGSGVFVQPDTSVFVPLSEGPVIKQSSNYTGVLVTAGSVASVNATIAAIQDLLGSDAHVFATSSLLSSIQSIESSASTLLIGIAGISFIVAFMGIMTTMFTAVTERTREIGVMKALGFTSRQVLALFVAESLIIGFIGGAIGSLIGGAAGYVGAPLLSAAGSRAPAGGSAPAAASSGTGARTSTLARGQASATGPSSASSSITITPTIDPILMLEVTLVTSLMGMLAGLIPAWRASKLVPAEALRAL